MKTIQFLMIGGLISVAVMMTPLTARCDDNPENAQQPDPNNGEVLTRGPVHEAFADAIDHAPAATPIINKEPPKAIEELPPDQKPEGDDVIWIPGYWSYDEDRKDFIWVSGLWRKHPPGKVWIPGNWRQVGEGWQWVPGLWGTHTEEQSNLEYLPQPPDSLENGPAAPAPTANAVYVQGSWIYRSDRYLWQPGYWANSQANWIWIPSHYRWTPSGYIFINGYWDYPLANRGVLFAPMAFAPGVIIQPQFVYTPQYVVAEPCLYGALFVRRGYGSYYFGDYFGPRYAGFGYTPWCGGGFGVSVGFNVGRGFCDPLFGYYRANYPRNPYWGNGISNLYAGRYNGTIGVPPRTLIQQNVAINRITNNNINNTNIVNNYTTNNVTNINKTQNNITHVAMVNSLNSVAKTNQFNLQPVSQTARTQIATTANSYRNLAAQRLTQENKLGPLTGNRVQGGVQTQAPRSAALNVSKVPLPRPVVNGTQSSGVGNPNRGVISGQIGQQHPGITAHNPVQGGGINTPSNQGGNGRGTNGEFFNGMHKGPNVGAGVPHPGGPTVPNVQNGGFHPVNPGATQPVHPITAPIHQAPIQPRPQPRPQPKHSFNAPITGGVHTVASSPVQQYHAPVQQVHQPVQQYHQPVQQYHPPAQQVHQPVQQVHQPVQQYHPPVQQYHSPVQPIHQPVQQVHQPVQQYHPPVQQYHPPVQQYHPPVQQYHPPVQQVHQAPIQHYSPPPVQHMPAPTISHPAFHPAPVHMSFGHAAVGHAGHR